MAFGFVEVASVSVVIPVYRARCTIFGAIKSVAAQTMPPMEVIVIDDGSDDGGAADIKAFASRYPTAWLKVIALAKNQGAASARNIGWNAAQGEFIAFLDADDEWHPQKIEYQYTFLRSNPDVMLCGHGFRFIDSVYNEPLPPLRAEQIKPLQVVLSNPFVTPSVMLRADLPFRFKTGKRHMEDHLLWMEIALAGYKIMRLSAPLTLLKKAQFGESGLSANLWAMEVGELHNYWLLGKQGRLRLPVTIALMLYSVAKYVRRLLIVAARRARADGQKNKRVPPT